MTVPHPVVQRAVAARALRDGDLTHDLAVFAHVLRDVGVTASTASSLHALGALTVVGLARRQDVREALACCLTGDPSDRPRFDLAFDAFWSVDDAGVSVVEVEGGDDAADDGDASGGGGDTDRDAAPDGGPSGDAAGLATYSTAPGDGRPPAVRRRREIDELCRRLARGLGRTETRRWRLDDRGHRVDLRASVRHNLRYGEEVVRLQRTAPRRDQVRLAVLCDVSSSMRPYTPWFLAFVHSLTRHVRRVEAAVFDVETVVVTDVFRRSDLRRSTAWLEHQDVARSGGTRIGHCLHAFLDAVDGRGGWRADTLTLVLSDGWDVGEPDLLREGMRRLRERSRRVVWCDPHAAAAGFHPRVGGLQVALPLVDDHVDLSSPAALSGLVDHLTGTARRASVPFTERTPA